MEIENFLRWWANRAMQFSHVSFLACQVLGIVGFQIETKWIFSVVGIITNLLQSKLGIDNLDHRVLVIKNCMITNKLNKS